MSYVDLNTVHVPGSGLVPPRTWGQQIADNFASRLDTPAVEAARFGVTVPDNTQTTAEFTGAAYDSHDMHDPAVNPHRFTAPEAGWYLVVGAVVFPPSATSGRGLLSLWKNGAVIRRSDQPVIGSGSRRYGQNIRAMVPMNIGDYLELRYYHTYGGSPTAGFRFAAARMAPLAPSAAFTYQDLDLVHRPEFRVPVPDEWAAQIRTNFESLRNRPICILSNSAAQSIPTATAAAINLNVEDSDAFGMHSGSTNQIVVPRHGTYLALANGVWAANSSGIRMLAIETNFYGTFFSSPIVHPVPGDVTGISNSFILRCPADGGVIQLTGYQVSGGNLSLQAGAQLALIWLGE